MRFLLAVLVLAIIAAQVSGGFLASRTTVPQGWQMLNKATGSEKVSFTIGLKTQNDAELDRLFWAVSNPESDEYLMHLTTQQINERFGAAPADMETIQSWLEIAGVTEMKAVHGAISVITTSSIASKLFNTEMRVFQHTTSGKQVVKAWGAFSLPESIHKLVEIVTGLSSFPVPSKNPFKIPTSPKDPKLATEVVLPQTIQNIYDVRAQTPGSYPAATQAVIEYEGQYFSNADTILFAKAIGYTTTNTTIANVTADHIIGTNNQRAPQIEASLDIEWLSAISLEATSWFWIENGNGWVYEFGTHFLNFTTPPQVTSTSYGWWEGDQCAIDGAECQVLGVDSYGYTAATNKLFQKIGVAGTSLLVSSGDSGANGRTDEGCSIPQLRPEFPSSSPYVTSVGATEIRNATYYDFAGTGTTCSSRYSCILTGVEVAVSLPFSGFTSGGGFSNVTGAGRPDYQDAVVQAYLKSGVTLPPSSYYNMAGRGAPDIAAVGHNGLIVSNGAEEPVGGTSMSSPIVAGLVSLINQISLTKTGNSLGFLNPLLYTMVAADPTTVTDITVGDNICPEYGCEAGCRGFVATKGWDPVTGLGTPVYSRIEAYVSSLMDKVVARRAAKAAKVNKITSRLSRHSHQ